MLNKTVGPTPLGKALSHAAPIIEAALSDDPAWRGFKLGPLPGFETPEDAG